MATPVGLAVKPVADRLDEKAAEKAKWQHDGVLNTDSIHLAAVDTAGVSTRLAAKKVISEADEN